MERKPIYNAHVYQEKYRLLGMYHGLLKIIILGNKRIDFSFILQCTFLPFILFTVHAVQGIINALLPQFFYVNLHGEDYPVPPCRSKSNKEFPSQNLIN